MSGPRVLFVGGTGIISSACVVEALTAGMDVTVLNRGRPSTRPLPDGVASLTADVRDPAAVRTALGSAEFDAVVDFVAFTHEHVHADVELFTGRTGQYVFISSASAYQTPPARLPITEATPLANPHWQYSRDKIACELSLAMSYRSHGFPVTVVRPSHTYDRTSAPTLGGWTDIVRMRAGKPVPVHGDGTSLWTLTHHADFARAFVGLLGRRQLVGETVHITSDEWLTWEQIYRILGAAAGVAEPELVHITSDVIAREVPDWGPGLLGDRTHSAVFDNSRVKALVPGWAAQVPFDVGAREIVSWHDAEPDRSAADPRVDKVIEDLLAATG